LKTSRKLKRINLPIHPALKEKLLVALEGRQEDNDYICPNLANRYGYNASGVKKDAIKVFRECGFGTSERRGGRWRSSSIIGFHSLRHSFVSFCANAGISLAVVQSLVGHGSPAMTRHYTHISKESAEKAINALPMSNSDDGKAPSDSEIIVRIKELVKKYPNGELANEINLILNC